MRSLACAALLLLVPATAVAQTDYVLERTALPDGARYELIQTEGGWLLRLNPFSGETSVFFDQIPRTGSTWQPVLNDELGTEVEARERYQILVTDRSSRRALLFDTWQGRTWRLVNEDGPTGSARPRWRMLPERRGSR